MNAGTLLSALPRSPPKRSASSCHSPRAGRFVEAFEEAFRVGEKPITVEVIEAVLSRQIDDLEPKLMRHGYDVRILASQFNAKLAEIRQFLQGALDADRARELTD
jgi:hypothetical protein